jgi:hypothetical protein
MAVYVFVFLLVSFLLITLALLWRLCWLQDHAVVVQSHTCFPWWPIIIDST